MQLWKLVTVYSSKQKTENFTTSTLVLPKRLEIPHKCCKIRSSIPTKLFFHNVGTWKYSLYIFIHKLTTLNKNMFQFVTLTCLSLGTKKVIHVYKTCSDIQQYFEICNATVYNTDTKFIKRLFKCQRKPFLLKV